jgi:hypothetical protein
MNPIKIRSLLTGSVPTARTFGEMCIDASRPAIQRKTTERTENWLRNFSYCPRHAVGIARANFTILLNFSGSYSEPQSSQPRFH